MEESKSKDTKELNEVKELQKQNRALLELVRQLQVKLYVAESRLKEKEVYEEELKKTHEEQLLRLNALFERLLNETFARLSTRSEVGNDAPPPKLTSGSAPPPKAQASNSSGTSGKDAPPPKAQASSGISGAVSATTNGTSSAPSSASVTKVSQPTPGTGSSQPAPVISLQPTPGTESKASQPTPSTDAKSLAPNGVAPAVSGPPPTPGAKPNDEKKDAKPAPPKAEAPAKDGVAPQPVPNPEQMKSKPSTAIRESAKTDAPSESTPKSGSEAPPGQTFV